MDIASLSVSAGWEGDAAVKGLEALGLTFDKTANRLRNAQGQFVKFNQDAQGATGAANDTRSAFEALGEGMERAGGTIRNVGLALSAGITAPLGAAVGYIIKVGSATSQTLNQFQGTSGATAAQMEKVRAKAKELGADLLLPGTSAGQAAEAMLELQKGGLSVEASMEAARGSIQLARAAIVSEGEAAEMTANTLNTFELASDQAGRASDVLANAANKSTGSITDFAMGLSQAGMVARASNVSLEETTAVLALLANNGMKGSDAGTSLKTFLLALRGPSDDARAAMKKLGVDAYDAQGRLRPMAEIIEQFTEKLSKLKDSSRDAVLDKVFGSDGARVAIALFGKGREEFQKYVDAMSEAGTAQRVAEANTRGLTGAWDAFGSTLSTLADSVYEDLEAPLTSLVQMMTGAVSWVQTAWDSMGAGSKVFVAALAGVAAAAGPVLVAIGAVVSAIGGVVAAVGAIGAGVTALGGAAVVLPVVAALLGSVVTWGVPLVAAFTAISYAAYQVYQAFRKNLGGVRDIAVSVWSAVSGAARTYGGELLAAWNNVFPTLLSLTSKFLQGIVGLWGATFGRFAPVAVAAFTAVSAVLTTIMRQCGNVVDFFLKLIDGDWKGAWNAFSRYVYTAKEVVVSVLGALKVAVASAFVAIVTAIASLGQRFYDAAVGLAKRLVAGLVTEVTAGAPTITSAIITALVLAAAGVNPAAIGAQVGASFVAGMRSAIANGAAQYAPGVTANAQDLANETARLASKNAGAGPAAPPPGGLKDLPLGNKGGGGGGGGGGESPRVKAAKAEAERLAIIFRQVQTAQQTVLDNEQYFYDEGKRSIEAYADARKSALIKMANAALDAAQREVAVANLAKGTAQERANALAAAEQKLAEVRAEYDGKLLAADREAARAMRDNAREMWAEKTAGLEATAQAQADIYQRLADQGVMTFARAHQAIAAAQYELLARERERLEKLLGEVTPDSPAAKLLGQQLESHDRRAAGFKGTETKEGEEAQRRDIQRTADWADQVRSIYSGIADSDREIQARRLAILEQAGVSRTALWRAQTQFELDGEREKTEQVIAELRRRIELTEQLEGNPEQKRALVAALGKAIEAEERASASRRAGILEDYYKKQDDRLRAHVDKIVGSFRKATDRFKEEGLRGFFSSLVEDFQTALLQMAEDLLKSRLLNLLRNIWKVPAPGSTQGGGARQQQGGGDFLDFFKQLINPGGDDGASAVNEAGQAMTDAIEAGGQTAAQKTTEAGEKQAINIRGVGISIVGALAAIGSQMAAGMGRGNFWSGLAMAAVSGFASGLGSGLMANASGGGGSTDGLSDYNPGGGAGNAAQGGMFRSTSGGRLIRVAEGGWDEVVLTTDPSQRGRMAALLEAYTGMTGVGAQGYAEGGFASGYVPPAPGSKGSEGKGLHIGELRVVVNAEKGMTTAEARRTGRQAARAATQTLKQFNG